MVGGGWWVEGGGGWWVVVGGRWWVVGGRWMCWSEGVVVYTIGADFGCSFFNSPLSDVPLLTDMGL